MAVAAPSIAIGLTGINDWTTQHPFLDRFKTSRDWVAQVDGGPWDSGVAVSIDENGYPTGIPAGQQRVTTVISVDPLSEWASGRYVVLYEGTGTITYMAGTTKVTSQSVDGRDIVTVNNQGEHGFQAMFLSITATDANDPIRNIRVIREDQLALYQAGETFNPEFLEKINDFRLLRFTDWMDTNKGFDGTFMTQRPGFGDGYSDMQDGSWTKGVPVEAMVSLANRAGTDAWFSMHHLASDDEIRAFATYVRDHLDPRLKVYVEFSNEVWNFQFEQGQYALREGDKRWAVDSNGNGQIDPEEHVGDGWVQWYGMRTAQVMDIWTSVFGAEASTRLERIIQTQTGWQGLEETILNASRWVAEGGNTAPYLHVDNYAITGYFEGGLYNPANVETVLQWSREGAAGLDKAFQQLEFGNLLDDHGGSLADLIQLYAYHANVANRYGLDMIMYEGGAHLTSFMDARTTDFFATMQRDPRMGQLYLKNIEAFVAAGGKLYNSFVDVGYPSKYGFWGALESIYQDGSARWDAITGYNATHAGDMTGRNPDAFADGTFRLGTAAAENVRGTAGGDALVGMGGNDFMYGLAGSDSMHGSDGADTLFGDAGADMLHGGSGNDRIFGGADRDTIEGSTGDDWIYGGAGADFISGGAGLDQLRFENAATAVKLRLDTGIGFGGEANGDRYRYVESVAGSQFGDTIIGSQHANWIAGGEGNDILYGLGGADNLIAGRGANRIYGGTGDDKFIFAATDLDAGVALRDNIMDFNRAAGDMDTIRFDGVAASSVTASVFMGGVLLRISGIGGGIAEIFLANATLAEYQAGVVFT